ncbi:UDP-N-acetylmuramoyl-L-alanine--D-glutamate ligase [Planctomycetota bacterium]
MGPKWSPGRKVLLFGLGRFGGQIEAARFFCRAGDSVTATDLKTAEQLTEALAALKGLPIRYVLGRHDREDFLRADLVCVSPAVPREAPLLRLVRERSIPWTTEMNIFLSNLRPRPIVVTGSNGKTTTTAMLGRVLSSDCTRRSFVGGNMGCSLLNRVEQIRAEDDVLLELSSFQLEDLEERSGSVARLGLVTNVTPNHLDRHGSFDRYIALKRLLVERLLPEDTAVLNRHDPLFRAFSEGTAGRVVSFGMSGGDCVEGTFVRSGSIWVRACNGAARPLLSLQHLELPGPHNLLNVLAALAAAHALSIPLDQAARALVTFRGLPHRLERVGTVAGVDYVNDSKATTPQSAIAALQSFYGGILWLGGGSDKGIDFEELGRAIARYGRVAVLFGETSEAIARAVAEAPGCDRVSLLRVKDLAEGFHAAVDLARPGETVLLSPACASYDQFSSYEERGARFTALVQSIRPRGRGGERRGPRENAARRRTGGAATP